ncbi:MAG: ABC transporter substrate-binding protein [Candidatus Bathyarchaeota archaeon]|nr:ABC transporter substrate-binding protein [Candidatus Bathyarchaeota archaeon]
MAEIGIDLIIDTVDYSVWYSIWSEKTEVYDKGGWDTGLDMCWLAPVPGDPDMTNMYHTKSAPPAGYNYARWSNGKVDKLLEDGVSTMNRTKRKETYNELYEILADELLPIPLLAEKGYYLYSSDLTDVEKHAAWQSEWGDSDYTCLRAMWLGSKTGKKTFVHTNYYGMAGCLPQSDWVEVPSATFGWLLQRYPPEFELQPGLAESWEISTDGLTYTYHLRNDVVWSDGVPFTSADVKFTFESLMNPDFPTPFTWAVKYIDYTEAPNDYTFILHAKELNALLFEAISTVAMYSKHTLESVPIAEWKESDYNIKGLHPSLGPLKIVDCVLEDHCDFVPNEYFYHWGETVHGWTYPTFDEYPWETVIFKKVPESAAALMGVEAGEIQAASWWYRFSSEKDAIETNPKLVGQAVETGLIQGLYINPQCPSLNNKYVRQAISYAINRQGLIDTLFNGLGTPTFLAILPDNWGWPEAFEDEFLYSYDLDKAKESMEKAGFNYEWIAPEAGEVPYYLYGGIFIGALVIGVVIGYGISAIRRRES